MILEGRMDMRIPILKELIEFKNANEFYTAKEVYDLIKDKIPHQTTVYYIGRYLASHALDKGASREGVVYLCRVVGHTKVKVKEVKKD